MSAEELQDAVSGARPDWRTEVRRLAGLPPVEADRVGEVSSEFISEEGGGACRTHKPRLDRRAIKLLGVLGLAVCSGRAHAEELASGTMQVKTVSSGKEDVATSGFEAAANESPWRANLPEAGAAVITTAVGVSARASSAASSRVMWSVRPAKPGTSPGSCAGVATGAAAGRGGSGNGGRSRSSRTA